MSFDKKVTTELGNVKPFHVMECSICGFDEIYYQNKETSKLVGRACNGCWDIQKFDFIGCNFKEE